MKARVASKQLLALAGMLISIIAILLVLRGVDGAAVLDSLGEADPRPLLAVLPVVALELLVRAARWRLILTRSQGQRLALVPVLRVMLVGYLGNVVLPARLGEPIRGYLIARREGLDLPAAFGSVVLERILDTAVVAVLVTLAATALRAPVWLIQSTALLVLAGALAALVWAAWAGGRLARISSGWIPPSGARRARVLGAIARFMEGTGAGRDPVTLMLAAAASLVAWLLDATIFWLVSLSIGHPLSPAGALLVSGITVLGTALPSAPGYIGVYELGAAWAAQLTGVPAAPALALAVVAHAITLIPVALAGAASLLGMGVGLTGLASSAQAAGDRPPRRWGAPPPE